MAKKSMVEKNERRLRKISLRKAFRRGLSDMLKNNNLSLDDGFKIIKVLDSTRDSSFIRYRNRCKITGRPRGFRGCVGMSRGAFREYASFGMVVGFRKI